VIRTDPAPGFVGLKNYSVLKQHHIALDIGRIKNVNKNPVAEKAKSQGEDHDYFRLPQNKG
jgi:hypothetical protein